MGDVRVPCVEGGGGHVANLAAIGGHASDGVPGLDHVVVEAFGSVSRVLTHSTGRVRTVGRADEASDHEAVTVGVVCACRGQDRLSLDQRGGVVERCGQRAGDAQGDDKTGEDAAFGRHIDECLVKRGNRYSVLRGRIRSG
jgi:hypothetical protein